LTAPDTYFISVDCLVPGSAATRCWKLSQSAFRLWSPGR